MTEAALERVAGVAKSWEAACRSLDNERIVDHLADHAVVWYNFQPDTEHTKAAYLGLLESSAATFSNQRYNDMRVHLHPGGFVEQATLVGDTAKGVIETPFLLVATVEGDRITRIAEYFDTTVLHKAGLTGE
jgi:ketosteroid isomerase-like protein